MTRFGTPLCRIGLVAGPAMILVALALGGCAKPPTEQAAVAPEPPRSAMEPTEPAPVEVAEPAAEPEEPADAAADDAADAPQEGGSQMTTVRIKTNRGDIVAELWDRDAPITAGSFLLLVEDGFYDGLTFHRVEPEFVIQGGDPKGNGSGGPGFTIPLETSPDLKHSRGVLSMARTPDPDSAGSQFFICLSDNASVKNLDARPGNPGYAAFGRVLEGMDVVDAIKVGDTIEEATVESESPDAEAARAAARAARVPE